MITRLLTAFRRCWPVMCLFLSFHSSAAQPPESTRETVRDSIDKEYPALFELYKYLHAHPELSSQEAQTSARVAEELRKAGFEVTTGVGKYGVVAVLRNGPGRTVLVRSDMDALPVKERTGLLYASSVMSKDAQGKEVPVMHACGHDVHMSCLTGVARVLAQLKNQWQGTLVLIAQPAFALTARLPSPRHIRSSRFAVIF